MGSTRLSPLGGAAREVASLGLGVFLLCPRGKPPLTPHGHLDATTEEAVIRRWWERRPGGNVGFAGHHLRHGVDPFMVLERLLPGNAPRCHPSLSDAEVTRTVESVAGCELRGRRNRG